MPAVCGSDSGYRRHLRRREVPCQRCRDAHALDAALRRERHTRAHRPAQPLLYRLALAGREPAEALTTADRWLLVAELRGRGWPVGRIAAHTRMTCYTTARICDLVAAATHLEVPA